jgi:hypothetical protein
MNIYNQDWHCHPSLPTEILSAAKDDKSRQKSIVIIHYGLPLFLQYECQSLFQALHEIIWIDMAQAGA